MADLLTVSGLTKTFRRRGLLRRGGEVVAVDDVSFSVGRGETLALVGESGAGKSTVGLLVLRLLDPDAGTIDFDGLDVRGLGAGELRRWRRRAQMIFQDPFGSFDPRKTIAQSLAEPLRLHHLADRRGRQEMIAELLPTIGLDDRVLDRYPYEFSGGQLQRLAVARAVILEPALVVCDEPVAALDMSIQAQVLNLLRRLQRDSGFSMLFISHDLSLVRVVAHRTIVMFQGRIVESGPTAEVYDDPRHPYTQALLAAVPVPDPETQRRRERILISTEAPSPQGCAFASRCPEVMAVCRTDRPPHVALDQQRAVACHLYRPGRAAPASAPTAPVETAPN